MTQFRKAARVTTLAALCACFDAVGPPAPTGTCIRPDLSTAGWQLIDRGGFTFRLPPGFVDQQVQPIDSDVMVFTLGDGDATLSFDFGIYGGELDRADCEADVGGARARMVTLQHEGEIIVVARWPDLGEEAGGARLGLSMSGRTGDPALVELLLAALHSVVIA